jgi:hypothetical protein
VVGVFGEGFEVVVGALGEGSEDVDGVLGGGMGVVVVGGAVVKGVDGGNSVDGGGRYVVGGPGATEENVSSAFGFPSQTGLGVFTCFGVCEIDLQCSKRKGRCSAVDHGPIIWSACSISHFISYAVWCSSTTERESGNALA